MNIAELADKLQAVTYHRSGKAHVRERGTVLKYARLLFELCPTGIMKDLQWIKKRTCIERFRAIAPMKATDDVMTVRYHRKAVCQLTALRAAAEVIKDEGLVVVFGALAATMQKGITSIEEQQTQTPEEKQSYKSFEELRRNVLALRARVSTTWEDHCCHLIYELMVPAKGDYALRLDLVDVRHVRSGSLCGDGEDNIYTDGVLCFNNYKTSKFKEDENRTVRLMLDAEQLTYTEASLSQYPRQFLLGKQDKSITRPRLSQFIREAWILDDRPPPTANNIRSAIITHFMNGENNKRPSILSVREFADRCMTSPAMLEVVYHKVDAS
jgi:hypothetical protein